MPIVDALLSEFEREMITTRTLLERVPDDKLDWKPHAKSMSLGGLAMHIANMVGWGTLTLDRSEFDVTGSPFAASATSKAGLLALFDANVTASRNSLIGKTDAELMAVWSLKRDGHALFTMPKASVLRAFFLNHVIHHRGQLSVYLRLNDVPLPSIYGPTADEPM